MGCEMVKPSLVSGDWQTYRQSLALEEFTARVTSEQRNMEMNEGLKAYVADEIKKSEMSNKYARIRIPMNHRKLINSG